MNKKQELKTWLKGKQYIKTSEILSWGLENFSNRALRNAQDLAQKEHWLVRLSDRGKLDAEFYGKEGVYLNLDFITHRAKVDVGGQVVLL